ncbi:hypothetical protein VNO80_11020 [Phaseolus coccineus]|uniref:Uncharacterized protein n=1 Tax=Phaseolus coccineus TaxID=3886 RepID=A0AAN9RED7_PHACN
MRLCMFLVSIHMPLLILEMKGKDSRDKVSERVMDEKICRSKKKMDEKIGRMVLARVVMHSRHHYVAFSGNFTGVELEGDGGDVAHQGLTGKRGF